MSLRARILEIAAKTPVHVGGCFSCVDTIDELYEKHLKEGDTFLLSKGHAALALYVVLEKRGILKKEDIDDFCTFNGRLGTHTDRSVAGVVASTGSLGHGLGMACGIALADRAHRVYCLISDGELFEGSTWEAIIQAPALKLDNLTLIVDDNGYQSFDSHRTTHHWLTNWKWALHSLGWRHWMEDKGPWYLGIGKPKGYGLKEAELEPLKWHYICATPSGKPYLP